MFTNQEEIYNTFKLYKYASIDSKALPAEIVGIEKNIAEVAFLCSWNKSNGQPIPNIKVPVAQSTYFRAPLEKGTFGFVLPVATNPLSKARQELKLDIADFENGVFMPVSLSSFSALDDLILENTKFRVKLNKLIEKSEQDSEAIKNLREQVKILGDSSAFSSNGANATYRQVGQTLGSAFPAETTKIKEDK